MALEALILEEGCSPLLFSKDRRHSFTFVRGFEDIENNSISMVLEETVLGLRRRYVMHTDLEHFYNIVDSKDAPLEAVLVPYFGYLLFGSMEIEDAFYNHVNRLLKGGNITPRDYESIVNKTLNRLKGLYAELFDGGQLRRKERVNLALLSAFVSGVSAALALSIKSTKGPKFLKSLAAAIGGFSGAYIWQKYHEKKEIIEKYRIRENDPIIGVYFKKALEIVQRSRDI